MEGGGGITGAITSAQLPADSPEIFNLAVDSINYTALGTMMLQLRPLNVLT